MILDEHENDTSKIRRDYLDDLHETAMYVFTKGAPFFVVSHFKFLAFYKQAWRQQTGAEAHAGPDLTFKRRIAPVRGLVALPVQFLLSVVESAGGVLKSGIRNVPPLITAVVVVFVTGDAWRILGAGFTTRFFAFITLFMFTSLLFLIRFRNYWNTDMAASKEEAEALLDRRPWGRRARNAETERMKPIRRLMERGADPSPIVEPASRVGRASAIVGYVVLAALSLIITALFVTVTLILVGVILIDAKGTQSLAQSVHIYWRLPGRLIITRELVSICLSLGAFSAFFLVASQHAEDRNVFMKNVLLRSRRSLVVYSIYCRAHDHDGDWTGIHVDVPPLAPVAPGDGL